MTRLISEWVSPMLSNMEAYNRKLKEITGCDLLFFADDNRYLALNIADKRYADNNYCTALGYISVLEHMMRRRGKDITDEKILVIGYGIVGKEAVDILKEKGVSFCVYDKDKQALEGADFELLHGKDEICKSGRTMLFG